MIDILGKNASIDSFPPQFFDDRNTLGLNHISVALKTKRVITSYPKCVEDFLVRGFRAEDMVGIKFNPSKPDSAWNKNEKLRPNEVEGLGSYVGLDWRYDRRHLPSSEETVEQFTHAVSRDFSFGYRVCGTVLHSAIFWSMASGYRELNIFGCNHTNNLTDKRESWWPGDSSAEEFAGMRGWTKILVREAKHYGITINWWKNYTEYQKGVLYYGD